MTDSDRKYFEKNICKRHKPFPGGMLQWYAYIEKKEKKKAKQRQCTKCKHWFFKNEY